MRFLFWDLSVTRYSPGNVPSNVTTSEESYLDTLSDGIISLNNRLGAVEKQAEATRRKVYRDDTRDNGGGESNVDSLLPGKNFAQGNGFEPTGFRTGDPVPK